MKLHTALTIAGTDPSGGAGIMADLKSFQSRNVYGMAVVTSVVAQNTTGVHHVEHLSLESIEKQLHDVYSDIAPQAVKTGMIALPEMMDLIYPYVSKPIPYVMDPVMIATSGDRLVSDEAVDFLNKMARRARKRNVSLAIISQRFQDFYEKPEAQAVLTSSDTKLFLAQDKSEIQQLKEVFKLSEGEASFLVTCSKGEGLLKVGQDTAVIQITPTRKEFEFVETNMNKLVANNQRDDQRNINKN